MRLPFLKRFAHHVFFGRGSFPDLARAGAEADHPNLKLAVENTLD